MAGSWLRGVVGVSLTLCVAGQALAAEGKVTVFAAASLTNAMQDIAQAYKKEKKRRGRVVVCLVFDASAADRSGCASGPVYLRRSEMDGLRGR